MKRQESPAAPMTAQALLDNLEDAGCGPEVTERFLALEQAGQYREQLRLLSDHRCPVAGRPAVQRLCQPGCRGAMGRRSGTGTGAGRLSRKGEGP